MRTHAKFASITAVAAGVALAVPFAAPASTDTASTSAVSGVVFGGLTAQDWPVVVELSKNGRRVVRASAGLRLTCTSGGFFNVPDAYGGLPVKNRKFSVSFGPTTQRNSDGTTTDLEGSISGSINKARSKVTGRWQLKATEHDAAGAVTDTCDSGVVSWSAKQ
jgi:hypothetical protein